MGSISTVSVENTDYAIDGSKNNYGVCSTAGATAAKTVTVSGVSELVTGAEVVVKFTNKNTVDNPTLNVNSLGAKAIYNDGAAIVGNLIKANKTYAFNIDEFRHAANVYAFFYDASKTFITRITTTYGFFPKVVTVPDNPNIAFVRLNAQTENIDISNGQAEENTMSTTYRPSSQKAIDESLLPNSVINFKNKKIVVFGDSITAIGDVAETAGNGWTSYFKASAKPSEWHNYAVGGSTWCDYSSGDFMSEQIASYLSDNISDVDCFIFSSGTNDINTHNPTDEEIEAQFFDENMNLINIDDCDRTTWAGAMRYAIGQVALNSPKAKIFVCTPIFRSYNSSEPVRSKYSTIKTKNEIIKKMCLRMGVECIDTLECGITTGAGTEDVYLSDGLHPKPVGAQMLAQYITARYMMAFNIE